MSDEHAFSCTLEDAVARPDRRDDLAELIHSLFTRRNQAYVGGKEKMWMHVEMIQTLRRKSEVYRETLSNKTSGPIPFDVGYFRLRGDRLEVTSDTLPGHAPPEVTVRLLSEFLQPGATFHVRRGEEEVTWTVDDVGQVTREPAVSPE